MAKHAGTVTVGGYTYRTDRYGYVQIPAVFLKEETRKIARSEYGPALLATGEKVSYVHGVGYVYTHKYSERAFRETLERLSAGERL